MPSAGCLQLKSRKSTNYCPVTGNLLPRTPAEPPFLFTGTIETKRSVTTLPCDTHECRRTIVFVAISLRHPACTWFNAYKHFEIFERHSSRRETLREEPKQKRSGGGVDSFGPSVLDSSVIRRVFVAVTPV